MFITGLNVLYLIVGVSDQSQPMSYSDMDRDGSMPHNKTMINLEIVESVWPVWQVVDYLYNSVQAFASLHTSGVNMLRLSCRKKKRKYRTFLLEKPIAFNRGTPCNASGSAYKHMSSLSHSLYYI